MFCSYFYSYFFRPYVICSGVRLLFALFLPFVRSLCISFVRSSWGLSVVRSLCGSLVRSLFSYCFLYLVRSFALSLFLYVCLYLVIEFVPYVLLSLFLSFVG